MMTWLATVDMEARSKVEAKSRIKAVWDVSHARITWLRGGLDNLTKRRASGERDALLQMCSPPGIAALLWAGLEEGCAVPSEKYLEFIQSTIARMAANSFQMKTWNVALASAVIGFAASKDAGAQRAHLAVVPSLVFWVLDAYYLGLERAFRELYKTAETAAAGTYSMSIHPTFWMYAVAFFRPAVSVIHGTMFVVIFCITR